MPNWGPSKGNDSRSSKQIRLFYSVFMSTFLAAHRETDIKKAFHMISNSTCIQFKPRQNELTYLKLKKAKWFGELSVCLFASPRPCLFVRSVVFIRPFSVSNFQWYNQFWLPRHTGAGRTRAKVTEASALSPPGARPTSAAAGGRSCSLSQTLAKWATSATRLSTH